MNKKKKNKLDFGKLRRLYNIVSHDEKLQSLIIIICCFSLMILITLYCLLFGQVIEMKKYIKTSKEYFNWINKYKDVYTINKVYITRKYVVIEYE